MRDVKIFFEDDELRNLQELRMLLVDQGSEEALRAMPRDQLPPRLRQINFVKFRQKTESEEEFHKLCSYQERLFELFDPSQVLPSLSTEQVIAFFNDMRKHTFLKNHTLLRHISEVPKHLIARLSSNERKLSGRGSSMTLKNLDLTRSPSLEDIEIELDEKAALEDSGKIDYVQRIFGKDSEVVAHVHGAMDRMGDEVYGDEKDDSKDSLRKILDLVHVCHREPFQVKGNPWDYYGFELLIHMVVCHEYVDDGSSEKGPVTQYSYARFVGTSDKYEFQEQMLYSEYVSSYPWGATRHSLKRKTTTTGGGTTSNSSSPQHSQGPTSPLSPQQ
eukprot:TRINITY_DN3521_c0_g1_i3.p1 TRINITY_DN3521_c0_g1~~TRINITY_DN3521_c0_g1_i3.p1  ORF type:complete len:331 (-),score=55.93 TRINITY_DN3521_c0_g1_i3:872-1864(-)